MPPADLTPFGFTPTESLVYATLLKLGPSTGYAVARATRLARANVYAALEGLVHRGAASRAAGERRPARYRPTDPQALLVQFAAEQGAALDRLTRALRDAAHPTEPATHIVAGARAVANLAFQLVARAERRVAGVLAAELWRPTLPAWRRAATRATITLRLAGDAPADAAGFVQETLAAPPFPDAPTVLVFDDTQMLVAGGAGEDLAAVWSSHPLLVTLARGAVSSLE